MTTINRIVFFPLMVAICSCHTFSTPVPTTLTSAITPEISPTDQAILLPSAAVGNEVIAVTQESANVFPTPSSDPLRFVFPTPAPAAASAWRPPLYPTPWVPTSHDHFYFARPIAADEINWPLANYRYGGVFFTGVVHTGIDIPVAIGTPITAAGSGRVNWAGYGLYRGANDPSDPYGLAVVIRHDFGYDGQTLYTVYGHMSRIDVKRGQQVETGDLLGLSGATGNVTGPHLHFEVRIGHNSFSRSRNPELWLSPPQGWGILAGKIMDRFGNLMRTKEVVILSKNSPKKWSVRSYGEGSANSDPYYDENLVIGDLPAGDYQVWIPDEKSTFYDIKDLTGHGKLLHIFTGRGI